MGTKILEGYSHPMLYVNDLARAVAWYKDVLGFEARFVAPDYGRDSCVYLRS
jgi:catechol 2,3-dioxygenase-like lactoylglutathione lyase family enzyme